MGEVANKILRPGELLERRSKLRVGTQAGMVVVEFEKEIAWLTMTKSEAIGFIQALADHVNRL